jgi:hypothetical protein
MDVDIFLALPRRGWSPPGFFGSWRCGRGRPSGRPGTRRLLIAVSQLAMVYSPMIDDDRWFIETLHSTTSVSWWSLYVSVVEEGTFGEVESQRHFPRCCREEHMGLICPSLLFGCHSRYFILFYYTNYIYIYVPLKCIELVNFRHVTWSQTPTVPSKSFQTLFTGLHPQEKYW